MTGSGRAGMTAVFKGVGQEEVGVVRLGGAWPGEHDGCVRGRQGRADGVGQEEEGAARLGGAGPDGHGGCVRGRQVRASAAEVRSL